MAFTMKQPQQPRTTIDITDKAILTHQTPSVFPLRMDTPKNMKNWLISILANRRWQSGIICGVVILYLLLTLGSAVTERPGIDEGLFANPAYNLSKTGSMGSP